MSKFLSDMTARMFFRTLSFIVCVLSIPLWYLDKLTNSQIGYLCAAVVMAWFPKKFALKILEVIGIQIKLLFNKMFKK